MEELAIILPVYNEALTLKDTLMAFRKYAPNALLVVIDNNSNDNSFMIAQSTLKEVGHGLLLKETKQGKALAIKKALKICQAKIYVLVDADMSYPAQQIHELINPIITKEAHMVVGDRISSGYYARCNTRPLHLLGNKMFALIIKLLFKQHINDVLSGYRAISYEMIANLSIESQGFEIESELTIYSIKNKFTIKEIPIIYQDRPCGSFSKLSTFSDGIKILQFIYKQYLK